MQSTKNEILDALHKNDFLEAVLLLGKIRDPELDRTFYRDRVLEMAARAWQLSSRAKRDPIWKAQQINRVIYTEYGLQGRGERGKNTIDDPARFLLHSVLDRKVGGALALTVLYLVLAEQIGLQTECYAFPNHYLVKVKDVAGDFYVDPYEAGRFLTQEEFQRRFRSSMQRHRILSSSLYEKLGQTQLVARLAQQLKHAFLLKSQALQALRAVEVLAVLYPASPELARDRGILYCEMEYFSKAVEDLSFYLKERPEATDVPEIKKLTNMLRGYREIMN